MCWVGLAELNWFLRAGLVSLCWVFIAELGWFLGAWLVFLGWSGLGKSKQLLYSKRAKLQATLLLISTIGIL